MNEKELKMLEGLYCGLQQDLESGRLDLRRVPVDGAAPAQKKAAQKEEADCGPRP